MAATTLEKVPVLCRLGLAVIFDRFAGNEGLTIMTRISTAAIIKFFAPKVRRLIEGGAYFKNGRYKNSFLLI